MTVFTTCLRLIFRRPIYLVVYIGLFSLLGLTLTATTNPNSVEVTSFTPAERPIAVIDRDHSVVSQDLTDFLAVRGELVALPDQPRALQDAVAQNRATYIVIIPAGYGAGFIDAARSGATPPTVETIISYEVISGVLLDAHTTGYLNALRLTAQAYPELSQTDLVAQARQVADLSTPRDIIRADQPVSADNRFAYYVNWSSFPLTQSIMTLTAFAIASFRSGELRRRNLASPRSTTRMNLQIGAACLTLVGLTLAFIIAGSLTPLVGGIEVIAHQPIAAALTGLAALVYCLIPLALGFLISQFALHESVVNGLVTITTMAMTALSGFFIGGADLLPSGMQIVARGMPPYWYAEAVKTAIDTTSWSWTSLTPYLSAIVVMLAFAVAIFSVALLLGHLRAQTATSGGNPAAVTAES